MQEYIRAIFTGCDKASQLFVESAVFKRKLLSNSRKSA